MELSFTPETRVINAKVRKQTSQESQSMSNNVVIKMAPVSLDLRRKKRGEERNKKYTNNYSGCKV